MLGRLFVGHVFCRSHLTKAMEQLDVSNARLGLERCGLGPGAPTVTVTWDKQCAYDNQGSDD